MNAHDNSEKMKSFQLMNSKGSSELNDDDFNISQTIPKNKLLTDYGQNKSHIGNSIVNKRSSKGSAQRYTDKKRDSYSQNDFHNESSDINQRSEEISNQIGGKQQKKSSNQRSDNAQYDLQNFNTFNMNIEGGSDADFSRADDESGGHGFVDNYEIQ